MRKVADTLKGRLADVGDDSKWVSLDEHLLQIAEIEGKIMRGEKWM
jgi:hypothetical protein